MTSPLRKSFLGLCVAFVLVGGFLTLALLLARWTSLAPDPSLWVRTESAEWKTNRDALAPYFSPSRLRRPLPQRVSVAKDPHTYRLLLLGSSAAQGDPEPSFGPARQLEILLQDAFPDLRFEVLNGAVTAINSLVVARLARDSTVLSPDAMLVYEGNNEVIGPFSPTTEGGSGFTLPLRLAWRHTRLGLWLHTHGRTPADETWRGLQQFVDQELGRQDPRLEVVEQRFAQQLVAIVQAGRSIGATVWLSTVAVNRDDFAPFRSAEPAELSPDRHARWQALREEGRRLLEQGSDALTVLREAQALAPHHAETAFLYAQALRRAGQRSEADRFAQMAVDEDRLRFRTDSRLNGVIRRVAQTEGVPVIDLEGILAQSDEGLGDVWFYEHVHFTMAGAYQFARAAAEAVRRDLVRRGRVSAEATPAWLDLPEVRRRLAYSPYEQELLFRELLDRYSQPPFTGRWGNEAKKELYRLRLVEAQRRAADPALRAGLLQLYQEAVAKRPRDSVLWRNFGTFATVAGEFSLGSEALARSFALEPEDTDTLAAALALATASGKPADALRWRAHLEKLEPRHPGLLPALQR